ncbi:MAG: hypothetical protein ACPGRZ_00775 [Alphaproteobacteria bacterium]
MKLIVLLLIIGAVWYGFKMIGRRNINKQAEDARRDRVAGEDMTQCAVCGTYVPTSQSDCGREGCPY